MILRVTASSIPDKSNGWRIRTAMVILTKLLFLRVACGGPLRFIVTAAVYLWVLFQTCSSSRTLTTTGLLTKNGWSLLAGEIARETWNLRVCSEVRFPGRCLCARPAGRHRRNI